MKSNGNSSIFLTWLHSQRLQHLCTFNIVAPPLLINFLLNVWKAVVVGFYDTF